MPLMPPTNVAAPTVGGDFNAVRRDIEELYRRTGKKTDQRFQLVYVQANAPQGVPIGTLWFDTSVA